MATIEEQLAAVENQRNQFQTMLQTELPEPTKNSLRLSIEQLNKNEADLRAQLPQPEVPAPVETPVVAPQPEVNVFGQIENVPEMRPAEQIRQEVVSTTPETPAFEQEQQKQQIETPVPQQPRRVTLSDVASPAPSQPTSMGLAGANIPISSTTTTQTKMGVQVPEDIKRELTDGGQALESISRAERNLGDLALQTDLIKREQALQMAEEAELRQARQNAFMEKYSKDEAALNDEAAKLSKEKIDSKAFWKNLSTGQTIGAALSILLGGIGSALQGSTSNTALQMILNAAENDVKDQVRNLDNKKAMNKQQRQNLKDTMGRFQTEEAGRLAVTNTRLKALDTKMEGLEAKARSEAQRVELAKTRQGVQNQINNNRLKIVQLEAPQVAQSTVTQSITPAGAAIKAAKSAPTEAQRRKAERETRSLEVPGFKGEARSAKEAQELRASVASNNTLKSSVQEIEELNAKVGSNLIPSNEAAARIETTLNQLKGQLRTELIGPGAVTDTERKFLDQMLANPTDIFELNNMARLKQLQSNIERHVMSKAKVQGLEPVGQGSRARQQFAQ